MHTASWGEPKTHAQGINEKDLGTRSLLSGYLGHAILTLPSQPFMSFIVRFSVPSLLIKFSSSLQPLFIRTKRGMDAL